MKNHKTVMKSNDLKTDYPSSPKTLAHISFHHYLSFDGDFLLKRLNIILKQLNCAHVTLNWSQCPAHTARVYRYAHRTH